MRAPAVLYLLRVVALVALTPFFIFSLIMLIIDPTEWMMAMPVMAFVLSLGGIVFVADRLLSTRHRAKRLLKRHPGLIGPLTGHLDDFGITYFSENLKQPQQFSWPTFPKVVVDKNGIRLDWKSSDAAFIAIPAASIDEFDELHVRREVERLQQRCSEPAVCQVVPDWSRAPPGALRFQNLVHARPPLSPKQRVLRRIRWAIDWLLAIGIIAAAILDLGFSSIAVLMAASIVVMAIAWRLGLGEESARYMFRQWGWLTEQGGQAHLPGMTAIFNWHDASSLEIDESRLLARFNNDTAILIKPEDLQVGDWPTLIAWLSEHVVEN